MAKTSCFIDIHWLQAFGLRKESIMEYFYTSPFYDTTSNNAIMQTQGIQLDHLRNMTGLEFSLDEEIKEEPVLFVIRKQFRYSPVQTDLLDIYYILDGTIYQSPDYLDLVRSRFLKLSLYINEAHTSIRDSAEYTVERGHHIKRRSDNSIETWNPKKRIEDSLDFSSLYADLDVIVSKVMSKNDEADV